jgi:hypothetical protein
LQSKGANSRVCDAGYITVYSARKDVRFRGLLREPRINLNLVIKLNLMLISRTISRLGALFRKSSTQW